MKTGPKTNYEMEHGIDVNNSTVILVLKLVMYIE